MADAVPTQQELGVLSGPERDLIHLIRTKYRFGSITVETRDGQPTFIEQTIVRTRLGT